MTTQYHVTLKSRNVKVGKIPVVTASKATCPDVCPLKNGGGCYAESGPLALHWDQVTSGERGGTLSEVLEPIAALPAGAIWRYGQAGDLPGENLQIDRDGLMAIANAAMGKRTILYTHKPPTKENLAKLTEAKEAGLHINLSANSPRHADMLAKTGFDVVSILPAEFGRTTKRVKIGGKTEVEWAESLSDYKRRTKPLNHSTPAGRKIAICPATYLDTNCAACGLCAKPERNGAVVGFPAHGSGAKRTSATARG